MFKSNAASSFNRTSTFYLAENLNLEDASRQLKIHHPNLLNPNLCFKEILEFIQHRAHASFINSELNTLKQVLQEFNCDFMIALKTGSELTQALESIASLISHASLSLTTIKGRDGVLNNGERDFDLELELNDFSILKSALAKELHNLTSALDFLKNIREAFESYQATRQRIDDLTEHIKQDQDKIRSLEKSAQDESSKIERLSKSIESALVRQQEKYDALTKQESQLKALCSQGSLSNVCDYELDILEKLKPTINYTLRAFDLDSYNQSQARKQMKRWGLYLASSLCFSTLIGGAIYYYSRSPDMPRIDEIKIDAQKTVLDDSRPYLENFFFKNYVPHSYHTQISTIKDRNLRNKLYQDALRSAVFSQRFQTTRISFSIDPAVTLGLSLDVPMLFVKAEGLEKFRSFFGQDSKLGLAIFEDNKVISETLLTDNDMNLLEIAPRDICNPRLKIKLMGQIPLPQDDSIRLYFDITKLKERYKQIGHDCEQASQAKWHSRKEDIQTVLLHPLFINYASESFKERIAQAKERNFFVLEFIREFYRRKHMIARDLLQMFKRYPTLHNPGKGANSSRIEYTVQRPFINLVKEKIGDQLSFDLVTKNQAEQKIFPYRGVTTSISAISWQHFCNVDAITFVVNVMLPFEYKQSIAFDFAAKDLQKVKNWYKRKKNCPTL